MVAAHRYLKQSNAHNAKGIVHLLAPSVMQLGSAKTVMVKKVSSAQTVMATATTRKLSVVSVTVEGHSNHALLAMQLDSYERRMPNVTIVAEKAT